MSARVKRRLWRVIAAIVLFVAAFVTFRAITLPQNLWYIELIVYACVYAVAAYDVLIKAFRGIFGGQVFDENLLMTIATVGAFCVREYPEAAAVMLFYQVGELFQSIAVGRSRKSISELMDIRPDTAVAIRDGERVTVSPYEVAVGEIIEVRAGERVALDGVVVKGSGSIDTAALTGESMPVSVREGSPVLSGSINLSGVLEIEVQKEFSESTASKILDLVENAASKKAKAENFITAFAKIYTPVVVALAVLLAVVPSVITGNFGEWIHRALMFLVVSCPCALVISVPLAFFGGIGAASARGVLIKGGNYLELLGKLDAVVFDKTGTLTLGKFSVAGVYPESRRNEILSAAAIAESGSNHPIALSIVAAASDNGLNVIASDKELSVNASDNGLNVIASERSERGNPLHENITLTEIAGKGVEARADGKVILAGNAELMAERGIEFTECAQFGTLVYVAVNGEYLGVIVIADTVKEDAPQVIASLKRDGIRTVMLTGDNFQTASAVAEKVGIDEFSASLLPADKVEKLEEIIARKSAKSVVAFVGDGINDAPVLSRADVGIAMGALGSDSAIEAADVVLMHDGLGAISEAKTVAKKTMSIAAQNIAFALIVKVAVLVLSALGVTDMWLAIFADVGVTVLAVLNSVRIIAFGKKNKKGDFAKNFPKTQDKSAV
ncbi:MAG: heavy metal translocating P-type ATPase [Clostridia bacterium]|nr:heavy metal translocating P-type ATPase [Clostridia bacterium]